MIALLIAVTVGLLGFMGGYLVARAHGYSRVAEGFRHMANLSIGRSRSVDAQQYSAREIRDAFGRGDRS